MGYPSKLLNEGESIVIDTRTHPKVLIGPFLISLFALAAGIFAARWIDGRSGDRVIQIVIAVLVVAVLIWFAIKPFVSWWTNTYTFTNRRFVARSGFISKEGRTIPLNRISGVDFEIGVVDRLFGCGTLIVSDASENGRVELHDIPAVERVQLKVADEIHRLAGERGDDGT